MTSRVSVASSVALIRGRAVPALGLGDKNEASALAALHAGVWPSQLSSRLLTDDRGIEATLSLEAGI